MRLCENQKRPVEEAGLTCQCRSCKDYRRANRTVRFQFTHEGHNTVGVLKVRGNFDTVSIEFYGLSPDHKNTYTNYYFDGKLLYKTVVVQEQYGYEMIKEEWRFTAAPDFVPVWEQTYHDLSATTLVFENVVSTSTYSDDTQRVWEVACE